MINISTERQLVSYVAERMVAQRARSVGPNPNQPDIKWLQIYRYRMGTLRSPVGWVIDDDHYSTKLEGYPILKFNGRSWGNQVPTVVNAVKGSLPKLYLCDHTIYILARLDRVHDELDPPKWERAFQEMLTWTHLS